MVFAKEWNSRNGIKSRSNCNRFSVWLRNDFHDRKRESFWLFWTHSWPYVAAAIFLCLFLIDIWPFYSFKHRIHSPSFFFCRSVSEVAIVVALFFFLLSFFYVMNSLSLYQVVHMWTNTSVYEVFASDKLYYRIEPAESENKSSSPSNTSNCFLLTCYNLSICMIC